MKNNIPPDLKQKIEEAIDVFGLSDIQKDKIVSGLLENISSRINMAISDELTREDKEKIFKILKAKDSTAVFNYLNGRIKNLPELVRSVAEETIQEFKNLSSKP